MPSVSSRGRSGRRMKADINVVPYIDVMLVLLVIFMVTAPLITPGLIQLPSVGAASDVPVKPLEVQISEDGKIALRMREPGATMQDIARPELVAQVRSRVTRGNAGGHRRRRQGALRDGREGDGRTAHERHHPPGPAGGPVRRRRFPARIREKNANATPSAGLPGMQRP